jgi:hypothetical protein
MLASSVRDSWRRCMRPAPGGFDFGVGEAVLRGAVELLGDAGAHAREILGREDGVRSDGAVGVDRIRLEIRGRAVRESLLLPQPVRDARGRRVAEDEARHEERWIVRIEIVNGTLSAPNSQAFALSGTTTRRAAGWFGMNGSGTRVYGDGLFQLPNRSARSGLIASASKSPTIAISALLPP